MSDRPEPLAAARSVAEGREIRARIDDIIIENSRKPRAERQTASQIAAQAADEFNTPVAPVAVYNRSRSLRNRGTLTDAGFKDMYPSSPAAMPGGHAPRGESVQFTAALAKFRTLTDPTRRDILEFLMAIAAETADRNKIAAIKHILDVIGREEKKDWRKPPTNPADRMARAGRILLSLPPSEAQGAFDLSVQLRSEEQAALREHNEKAGTAAPIAEIDLPPEEPANVPALPAPPDQIDEEPTEGGDPLA